MPGCEVAFVGAYQELVSLVDLVAAKGHTLSDVS